MVTITEQSHWNYKPRSEGFGSTKKRKSTVWGTNSRLEYLPSTNTVFPRFSSTFGIMGEKVNLQPEGGSWTATTVMPYGVRPEK